jgi:hypothetical protein
MTDAVEGKEPIEVVEALCVSAGRPTRQSKQTQGAFTMIDRIVSGGQTGADRAALDWAIENGCPHGGWCPKGRLAEDGTIPSRYHLAETPGSCYDQRTDWNARDSDGTVIFSIAPNLSGGSKQTVDLAHQHGKPVIHISLATEQPAETLRQFIRANHIRVLNVAGPRASTEPGVGDFVKSVLDSTF